jgi:hypothetical protein
MIVFIERAHATLQDGYIYIPSFQSVELLEIQVRRVGSRVKDLAVGMGHQHIKTSNMEQPRRVASRPAHERRHFCKIMGLKSPQTALIVAPEKSVVMIRCLFLWSYQ